MKNIFFLLALLCHVIFPHWANAQTTRITYPINGMVIQQSPNGSADVPLSVVISGVDTQYSEFGYYIEPLYLNSGLVNYNSPQTIQWSVPVTSLQGGYYKLVNTTIAGLPKGWYKITFGPRFHLPARIEICSQIVFGVGDVYLVAGQSNASGYGGIIDDEYRVDEKETIQSYTSLGTPQHDAVRGNYGTTDDVVASFSRGLPFGIANTVENKTTFQILENNMAGTKKRGIYPNGRDSWFWVPFANKVASKGTPVALFNVAKPNSAMKEWVGADKSTGFTFDDPNKPLFKKMRSLLQNYNRATGLRAIIWQQGETDTGLYDYFQSLNQADTYLDDFDGGINNLYKWSRKVLTGAEANTNVNWITSRTTHFTGGNGNNATTDPNKSNFQAGFSPLRSTLTKKYTSPSLKSKQTNIAGGYNEFNGPDSDNLEENYRAAWQRIHFSGASSNNLDGLNAMAESWFSTIYNENGTYKIANNTVTPGYTALENLTIEVVDAAAGTFKIKAPLGYARYFWWKDFQGIHDVDESTSNEKIVFKSTNPEFWTCYMSNYNGLDKGSKTDGWNLPDLKTSQSFISKNDKDAQSRSLRLSTNSLSISNNSSTNGITVNSNSIVWNILNVPTWVSINNNTGGFGETPLQLNTSANTTNSPRSSTITFRDLGNIYPDQYLTISQSATSTCTQTNLSSLTPINPSSERQGYGTMQNNLNISGQTLMVGGYQTTNGIGTHANSRIVYNLGGQYNTFTGSVGRDDAADNCNCGTMKTQFIVKADGVTLFTSNLLGTADGKQDFSLSVSGRSQLELLVNDGGDNIYGDHADWLDAILYCGSAPTCTSPPPPPINVSSSPSTINSGSSSTLSATCSTGTVLWNTGATGNTLVVSPTFTTTYNAKCISGTCPESTAVPISVTVNNNGCSGITDGLVMGTWTVTNHQLVARFFHGQYWLTQRAGTNPEVFVVRGSAMLQRSDVNLTNSSYYNMINCFGWIYSPYGNLGNPSVSTFPTPSGFSLSYLSDGTMVYTANTGGGGGGSCTDTYVSNNWASATIGDGTPKIGFDYQGGTMTINGTNYTQGIGTHAGSEIVYNLGSHSYANFKASVGRDQSAYGCNCGGQTIVFKVYNHTTGALIGGPVTKGINQSASDMVVPIAGVSSIRLVVEDGGDQIWGDWANWANARFTCPNSNFRKSAIPEEEWLWISPNPNDGKFIAKVKLKASQKIVLYLTNTQGKAIKEYSFEGKEGENNFEIQIPNVQDQVYNLRCQAGEESSSKRIVIQK